MPSDTSIPEITASQGLTGAGIEAEQFRGTGLAVTGAGDRAGWQGG